MNLPKHTPNITIETGPDGLPWISSAEPGHEYESIGSLRHGSTDAAEHFGPMPEFCKRLVTRYNSHAALVDALKGMLASEVCDVEPFSVVPKVDCRCVTCKAHAALKLAQEK